jgi:hypothetical protein
VGEKHPASVLAEVTIDTRTMRGDVASGWDELKQHDVLFLMGGVCCCQSTMTQCRLICGYGSLGLGLFPQPNAHPLTPL